MNLQAHQFPLPQLIRKWAEQIPDKAALTSVGQGSVSWRELRSNGLDWAGWLRECGVRSGDRVVTLVPQSLESHYVWLGCAAIGAVEVSVNTEFRGEWLRHAINVSQATTIVLSKRYLPQVEAVLADTSANRLLIYDAELDEFRLDGVEVHVHAAYVPVQEFSEIDPGIGDTACILLTSGTTGASKAVDLPWGSLYAISSMEPIEEPRDITFYVPYAPYHLSGRTALYRAAVYGGHAVVRESFSTSQFWPDVRTYGCTWALLYPAPTRYLASLPASAEDADNPLELVLMVPPVSEVDEVKRRYGFEVYSIYGMTEIGTPFILSPEYARSDMVGCCGVPVEGVEAKVVDAADFEVPRGEIGELVVRSSRPWQFLKGYQGDAEATARIYRNGWIHTGDLFRQDEEGFYWYVDRSKDMIRRRSENVSSVELEAAILSHPLVLEAAAVGVESELGEEEILAVVVPEPGFDPAGLIDYLKDRVPRFALPAYVRCVDELPRTQATQRVQKSVLREEGLTRDVWARGQERQRRSVGPGAR
ncbi:AMP-binding protein [Streptomyces sp. NPDC002577]